MTRYSSIAIACALSVSALSRRAAADDLGSRAGQYGAITHIDKGVFQLGLDSTLILGVQSEGDTSTSRVNATGNLMFRYFPKDSLGVSLRVGGLYRNNGDATDTGFVGAVWANYFMRLGEGVFFQPGIGAGLLLGSRSTPGATGGDTMQASLSGGVVAVELPLAVFLNPRFSLTAGPELVMTFGGTTPTGGDSQSFTAIDGGFEVGAVYSY